MNHENDLLPALFENNPAAETDVLLEANGAILPDIPRAPPVDPASAKRATLTNLAQVLTTIYSRKIRWDEFLNVDVIKKMDGSVIVDEAMLVQLAVECEQHGLTGVRISDVKKVVHAIAKGDPFDSMKDWLTTRLPNWDGIRRIERFLPDCLGTRDSAYEGAVGRYWWTAMAARILEPGCKADMVPVLVGKQGLGKTSLLQLLPPNLEQYCDVRLSDRPSELALKVIGKVLVAWEELRGIRGRVDADEVKTFITSPYVEVRSRTKMGTDQHLRRFIILGTSNRKDFLRDATGHRRYLPFDVHSIDLAKVSASKQQLWAEALHMVLERREQGQTLVDYEDAERLAASEHQTYLNQARWVDDEALLDYLKVGSIRFRTEDALKVVGIDFPTRDDRSEMRKSLEQIGLEFRSTYIKGQANRPKTWQWPVGSSRAAI